MRITDRSLFKIKKTAHNISNKTSKTEETVLIYDEIGFYGIDAGQFVKDFDKIAAKTIHVRFNSPGGSVFDGASIFNSIRRHKSKTISHIDGIAASIASVMALASDEVYIAENAIFMLHNPWSMVMGDASALRAEADLLDKISNSTIVKTYMDKTGMNEKAIKALMRPSDPGVEETWLTAEEALEMGFVDMIENKVDDERARADLFDLSAYTNVPNQLKGGKQPPTARELEKRLKEMGFSNKQAREILAGGLKDYQRDVDLIEDPPPATDGQRDVEPVNQRDVDEPPKKKDRTAELLTRGEVLAPTQYSN